MRASVAAALAGEGCPPDMMRFQAEADLHYVGQAYELTVPLPGADLGAAAAAFHAEHERTYGHASPSDAVELVNLRMIGTRADTQDRQVITTDLTAPSGAERHRRVRFPAGTLETPVVDRGALLAGRRAGPLIVEEYDSTSVVPPGWGAELDAHANIVITPEN
jgi:N-methylhydantoinase A